MDVGVVVAGDALDRSRLDGEREGRRRLLGFLGNQPMISACVCGVSAAMRLSISIVGFGRAMARSLCRRTPNWATRAEQAGRRRGSGLRSEGDRTRS